MKLVKNDGSPCAWDLPEWKAEQKARREARGPYVPLNPIPLHIRFNGFRPSVRFDRRLQIFIYRKKVYANNPDGRALLIQRIEENET